MKGRTACLAIWLVSAIACSGKEVTLGRGRGVLPDGGAGGLLGDELDPSAPPGARDAFGGTATPAARPRVVYPLDGAMLGRNLGGLTFQWEATAGSQIFRVRVRGAAGEARLYAGQPACPQGTRCQVYVPDALWRQVGRTYAGGTVELAIESVDEAGGPIAVGPSVSVAFTPEDLTGAVTYWSTLNTGLVRQGLDGPPIPFLAEGSGASGGRCVGCHVVSRDGCLTAAAAETNLSSRSLVLIDPEGNDRRAPGVGDSPTVFQAISPDRRRLVTVAAGRASLRQPDGRVIATLAPALLGADDAAVAHVDWAPDGSYLVFTRLPTGMSPATNELVHAGDIVVVPFTAPDRFGTARLLVARTDELLHHYPSVSPDSRFIVFTSAAPPGRSAFEEPAGTFSAYAQPNARLRLVPAAGGTPVDLSRATGGAGHAPGWARFAPTTQRTGQLMFILFPAKLDYGFTVVQAGLGATPRSLGGRAQLWIAALDLTRPTDPSFAPFWMPQQIPEHVNTMGIWTRDMPVTAAACPER